MQNVQLALIDLNDLKAIVSNVVSSAIDEKLNLLTTTKQNEYLTRVETAKELGIALSTLHEYTLSGIITGYRFGSRVRYKRTEIEAALKEIKSSK